MEIKGFAGNNKVGIWSPETSTVEWCEENYLVSPFIAEYWNTLSNLIMIIPPLGGAYHAYKGGLEWRYILCFLGVAMVGIGSWMFHMTLRYTMQLMDELPMLWAATFLLYTMMELCPRGVVTIRLSKTMHFRVLGMLGLPPSLVIGLLTGFIAVVTVVYVCVRHHLIHNIAYGVVCFMVVLQGARLIWTMECNRRLYIIALLSFVMGFVFWNLDNMFCHYLRIARGVLPPIFTPLTQFHALWHLLAGIGSYMAIVFTIHTRQLYLKRSVKVCNTWYLLPYVQVQD